MCGFGHRIRWLRMDGRPQDLCGFTKKSAPCGRGLSNELNQICITLCLWLCMSVRACVCMQACVGGGMCNEVSKLRLHIPCCPDDKLHCRQIASSTASHQYPLPLTQPLPSAYWNSIGLFYPEDPLCPNSWFWINADTVSTSAQCWHCHRVWSITYNFLILK